MKFFIAILAFAAVASAQYAAEQQPIAILRQAQDISPEGSYVYSYETENGIKAEEHGNPTAVNPEGEAAIVADGFYEYTAPDGTPVRVKYVADENGYHPSGDHIPVAPPVPEAIQRALAYIAANPPKPENPRY